MAGGAGSVRKETKTQARGVVVLRWLPRSLSVSGLGVRHFVCACVGSIRRRKIRFCLRLPAEAFL